MERLMLYRQSINSLIRSQTNLHANKSMENIDGQLSREMKKNKKIIKISSFCEYGLDIDENDDDRAVIIQTSDMLGEIKALINNVFHVPLFESDRKGDSRSIFGRPNVGKSTLFNSLLGYDRSIVSNVSGTTRDVIEASIEISGHNVRLIDTAGYRNTSDQIEELGINKTKSEVGQADIIICLGENKEDLLSFSKLMVNKNVITVLSKCDINKCSGYELSVSSSEGHGVKELLTQLSTKIIEQHQAKVLIQNILLTTGNRRC